MLKKITIVSPLNPWPADSGAKLKIYNLARRLHEEGFAVSMILCDPDGTPEIAPEFSFCEAIHSIQGAWHRPWIYRFYQQLRGAALPRYPQIHAQIHDRISEWKPAAVLVCGSFCATQISLRRLRKKGICTLLHHGGLEHVHLRRTAEKIRNPILRAMYRTRCFKMRSWEKHLIRYLDVATVPTTAGASILSTMNRNLTILTIPNGVEEQLVQSPCHEQQERKNIPFFCGDLSIEPNADALRFYLDHMVRLLEKRKEPARLVVAGAHMPSDILSHPLFRSRIDWLGQVENIHPFFERHSILINPVRLGGGSPIRLLEAMAHGMACLTTSIGAEGIPLSHETHALIADTPEAFVQELCRLLGDSSLRTRLGGQARTLVSEKLTWTHCIRPLAEFLRTR